MSVVHMAIAFGMAAGLIVGAGACAVFGSAGLVVSIFVAGVLALCILAAILQGLKHRQERS